MGELLLGWGLVVSVGALSAAAFLHHVFLASQGASSHYAVSAEGHFIFLLFFFQHVGLVFGSSKALNRFESHIFPTNRFL